jgi:hypothetical protein
MQKTTSGVMCTMKHPPTIEENVCRDIAGIGDQ